MELIITSKEQLETIIQESINRTLSIHQVKPEILDKCDLHETWEYLNQLGYKVRKSTIYKLSSKNDIPCQRIGISITRRFVEILRIRRILGIRKRGTKQRHGS